MHHLDALTFMYMTTSAKKLYGLAGKFKTKPGKGDAMANILLQAARDLQQVKGCHLYVISRDASDPDTIHVMEAWDSKEDHDNSLKGDDTKALIAQAMPLIDGKPEGTHLVVLGGLGLGE